MAVFHFDAYTFDEAWERVARKRELERTLLSRRNSTKTINISGNHSRIDIEKIYKESKYSKFNIKNIKKGSRYNKFNIKNIKKGSRYNKFNIGNIDKKSKYIENIENNNNNNNTLNMYDYGRLVKSMLMQNNEYYEKNTKKAKTSRIKSIIQINNNQGIICEPCKSGRLNGKQYYGLRLLNKKGKYYTAMRHTDIEKLQYIKDAIDGGKLNGNEINVIKGRCNNYKIAENTVLYLKGKLE